MNNFREDKIKPLSMTYIIILKVFWSWWTFSFFFTVKSNHSQVY